MHEPWSLAAFEDSCTALGAAGRRAQSAALHRALCDAWAEPHRAYHATQHLQECLAAAHEAAADLPARRRALLQMALWFHDAVYDVHAHDNEARSAAWARQALAGLGMPDAAVDEIAALVMATQHLGGEPPTRTPLVDLMLDIDLAILGAAPQRFAEYERQIRQEYAFVDADRYAVARRAVLQSFLARARAGTLYRTPWGARHAAQAIVNLGPAG